MLNLSENAKKNLDHYLGQVRTCLRGCKSVDPDEVEQNIMDHIESELAGVAEPVAVAALDPVLAKLGSPEQWIPEEEQSWWRKTILRLRSGPEDWRLAYICFCLLVLAFFAGRIGFGVLVIASFILGRAALSVAYDRHELGAQKWLIYPSLILVYLPLAILLVFCVPISVFVFWLPKYEVLLNQSQSPDKRIAFNMLFILIPTGIWWVGLSVLLLIRTNMIRVLFRPFAEWFTRKLAFVLLCIGVTLILSALLFVA